MRKEVTGLKELVKSTKAHANAWATDVPQCLSFDLEAAQPRSGRKSDAKRRNIQQEIGIQLHQKAQAAVSALKCLHGLILFW